MSGCWFVFAWVFLCLLFARRIVPCVQGRTRIGAYIEIYGAYLAGYYICLVDGAIIESKRD